MFFNIRFDRKYLLLCALLTTFAGSFVFGDGAAEKKINKNYAGHPHCGLYCLYSIMKLEGQEIDFRNLVKPEYLGSRKGSSFEELKQAADDLGINAITLSRLTPNDLKGISDPALLHVKSTETQKEYDHFVLYLGSKNGKAVIFDPPAERTLVEFGSLVPKWDGNALVVSSSILAASELASSSRERFGIYAGFVICGILAFHALKRLLPTAQKPHLRIGLSVGQAAGFAVIAVFAGLLCHYFYGGGFFANAAAVEGVQKAYAGNFIPKMSVEKMRRIYDDGEAVIFDARLKRDYDTGHIDGAVSLPINCSQEDYAQAVSSLPRDKRIVFYCQSAGCKFAEKIAVRLKEDGFGNLSVFKGGWVEWQKMNKSQSVKAEGQKNENKTVS